MKKVIAILAILLIVQTWAVPVFALRPNDKANKWAEKQLKKMTLDEKLGQMVHVGVNAEFLNQDSAAFQDLKRQVVENKIGGITVFVGDVYETVHLMNRMQEVAKIPLLISGDFETGVGMRFPDTVNFPWNMAVAATGNPDFARRQGEIVGRESRAVGVQQVYAPVVDVNNNSQNPVINVRSYGENPQEVARFGSAFMEGLQSQNILATAKHFPGHGDTAVDSHRGLPVIDFTRERLEQTEFVPFRALINAGIGSVMVSHISMPKLDNTEVKPLKESSKPSYADSEVITEATTIPATLSTKIVTDVLKNDMKFDGLVVTDAMDMSGLTLYFNADEGAVRAVLAGNDILVKPAASDLPLKGLREAVKSGRITEERINQSVRKILAWKYQLGLSEKKITPLDSIDTVVSSAETRKLSDEIANNAITLVKKEEDFAPIPSGKRVAVLCITNGEDRNFVGNPLTIALRQNGLRVERIVIDERATPKEIEEAITRSKSAEYVVAGLYGRVRSGAKNSIGLPAAGEKVLRDVLASNAKVISVSFGNPYLLLGFPEIKNYAVAYGDMTSLQRAAANAVTGKIEFKGKLPISIGDFPRGTGLSK
ncbi:MAG TPA: glycoside hydrolase family 3 N-terminal domain-containing protein [Pyrinomonadaceae bacterium]|nr:glycoside hydrolase family 3 N-terminal domain-containing protein [Pyrinomonadaceae bacterium]